jgi:hypothetical protein
MEEPFLDQGDRFEDYEPAYRFGYSLRGEVDDMDERESYWEERWNQVKAECRLSWAKARRAVRAAWQQAEANAKMEVESAMNRYEAKMCVAVQRLKDNIRRQPGDYVLGAVAAGYVAGRLPLRSMALTGIAVAAATAPLAMMFGDGI